MSVLKSICLYFKSICLYFCLSRSFPFHPIILFTHIWSEIDGTLADAAHQHTNTHTHSQTNTHTDSETGTERKIGTWIETFGRAASGGALAPEPPRVTRSQPEFHGFAPKTAFFARISG